MLRLFCVTTLFGLLPTIAVAEHKSSTDNDFTVLLRMQVKEPPKVAYAKFVAIQNWWHSSHTFSLNAKNLYIETKPKGWWGEKLPNGGFVKHMEVIFAAPGKMLRFRGGLGPLQSMPINGAMQVAFSPKEKGTEISLLYAVGGFVKGGVKRLGAPVDGVLKMQLHRLKRYIETGQADKDTGKK